MATTRLKFLKLLNKLKNDLELSSHDDAAKHIIKFWQAFDVDFVEYARQFLQEKNKVDSLFPTKNQ